MIIARKSASSSKYSLLTRSASFAAAASSELTCRKSIHGLPHPFSTTIRGTDSGASLRSSWMPAIASTSNPPASAAFRRIPQCCDTLSYVNFELRTDNTTRLQRSANLYLHCTFEASAIISGSSLAVTSFKAGNEFATRTTCRSIFHYVEFQYISRRFMSIGYSVCNHKMGQY